MSDFNLTVAPVMDPEHGEILGVVTVDDVLELLLPTGWRRDFGRTAVEDEPWPTAKTRIRHRAWSASVRGPDVEPASSGPSVRERPQLGPTRAD